MIEFITDKALYGDPVGFTQPHIIAEWWIREAGGISVTDDGRSSGERRTYTLEDLLLWNPDVIVANTARQIEEMRGNPNYRGVAAVKNKRCFVIPTVAHVWGNRTVEQPLVVLWMMNKLYPELMPEATLKDGGTTGCGCSSSLRAARGRCGTADGLLGYRRLLGGCCHQSLLSREIRLAINVCTDCTPCITNRGQFLTARS